MIRDHDCKGAGTGHTLPCAVPTCPKSPKCQRWVVLSIESGYASTFVRAWTGEEWKWLLATREPLWKGSP